MPPAASLVRPTDDGAIATGTDDAALAGRRHLTASGMAGHLPAAANAPTASEAEAPHRAPGVPWSTPVAATTVTAALATSAAALAAPRVAEPRARVVARPLATTAPSTPARAPKAWTAPASPWPSSRPSFPVRSASLSPPRPSPWPFSPTPPATFPAAVRRLGCQVPGLPPLTRPETPASKGAPPPLPDPISRTEVATEARYGDWDLRRLTTTSKDLAQGTMFGNTYGSGP